MNGIGKPDSTSFLQGTQRADASQLVSRLFARLDTGGKGSIDKATLDTAFSTLYKGGAGDRGKTSGGTGTSDAVFNALDTNGDCKLTPQETTDAVSSILAQIASAGGQGTGGPHHHHHREHGVQAAAAPTQDKASITVSSPATTAASDAAPSTRELMQKAAQLARAYADPVGVVSKGLSLLA